MNFVRLITPIIAVLLWPLAASPETPKNPTLADMKPLQAALHGFRDASLYAVGFPEQPPLPPPRIPADTDSSIMGCPIIASTELRRESWFDSLAVFLTDPHNYDQNDRLCDALGPDYIVRLRLATDTVTVATALQCAHLAVRVDPRGEWVAGWLNEDRRLELKKLLDSAIAEAMAHANTRPTVITAPEPVWPEAAREASMTGRVVLRVLVGADGHVKSASGRGPWLLKEPALQAVQAWTFNPARENGVPVAAWVDITPRFRVPLGEGMRPRAVGPVRSEGDGR